MKRSTGWLFRQIPALTRVTRDLDSTVLTRHGEQAGASRGSNPGRRGRPSHHSVPAFVAEARMVANLRVRPGYTRSANHVLQFLEATLHHLGETVVGLLLSVPRRERAWFSGLRANAAAPRRDARTRQRLMELGVDCAIHPSRAP